MLTLWTFLSALSLDFVRGNLVLCRSESISESSGFGGRTVGLGSSTPVLSS